MRPATVWSTRVTVTSTSVSIALAAALDHDHRAVVEIADALAGVLARLDHAHPEVLAGEQRGLHRVGQRVHVEDTDALKVGDPIQVEVIGEHRAPVLLRQRHELRVDLGRARDVLVDDDDRRRARLAHAGQDLQAAPAARPAHRVGAVGQALDLVEHEPGDLENPEEEARVRDVRDPAVDDGARVDEDARAGQPLTVARGSTNQAHRLGCGDEVVPLRDGEPDHRQPEEDGDAERRDLADRFRQHRHGQAEQEAQEEPEEQADDRRHELGGRQLLDRAQRRQGRDHRQVRQERVAEHDPGDDPADDEQGGAGGGLEDRQLCDDESDPDEPPEGGSKKADGSDHEGLD